MLAIYYEDNQTDCGFYGIRVLKIPSLQGSPNTLEFRREISERKISVLRLVQETNEKEGFRFPLIVEFGNHVDQNIHLCYNRFWPGDISRKT